MRCCAGKTLINRGSNFAAGPTFATDPTWNFPFNRPYGIAQPFSIRGIAGINFKTTKTSQTNQIQIHVNLFVSISGLWILYSWSAQYAHFKKSNMSPILLIGRAPQPSERARSLPVPSGTIACICIRSSQVHDNREQTKNIGLL